MRGDEGEILFQSCPSENRNFDQLPHLMGLRIPLPGLWGVEERYILQCLGLGGFGSSGITSLATRF